MKTDSNETQAKRLSTNKWLTRTMAGLFALLLLVSTAYAVGPLVIRIGTAVLAGQLKTADGSTNYITHKTPALAADIDHNFPTVAITDETAVPTRTQYSTITPAGVRSNAPSEVIIGQGMTTSSSIIGTAGATAFTFTGDGTDTIPAGRLAVGDRIRFTAGGTITTDGSESETLILTFKIGAKTIYTSLTNSYTTASTAVPWTFDGWITVKTIHASTGTAICSGYMATDPGVVGSSIVNDFTTAITSWDNTAAAACTVTATWGSGDATPDVATCDYLSVSINSVD